MPLSPIFSVVIPAYNQAVFLGDSIQSVLAQSFTDFEVIIVNDASTDHTHDVVSQFSDRRIKYINHPQNRGLPSTRNTGIRASKGEFIALLDADDKFHPEKLQAHHDFLSQHTDIGVTYNARYELHHSSMAIREIYRPPSSVILKDFVLGFPFSPSDMVLRRKWVCHVDLFDERYICGGEDLDFPCRLALAGCRFARVNRVLNYRRYHSGRIRKRLSCRLKDYTRALTSTFNHPDCPKDILSLRSIAFANHYLEVAYRALSQGELHLGQEILHQVIQLNPDLIGGYPSPLMNYLMFNSIMDENLNHEIILKQLMASMPKDLNWISRDLDWAASQGYIWKGTRAIMWEQEDVGGFYFSRASELGAQIDVSYLRGLTALLLSYELEMGPDATQTVMRNLAPFLTDIGGKRRVRWLKGCYFINQAFQCYQNRKFKKVPGNVMRALANDPGYLLNRGVLSISLRSAFNILAGRSNQYRQPE